MTTTSFPAHDAAAHRPLRRKSARPAETAFHWLVTGLTLISLGALAWLLTSIIVEGASKVTVAFLTDKPSSRAAQAGFNSAIRGSFVLMLITVLVAIPTGIAAALYLEKLAVQNSAALQDQLRRRLQGLRDAHAGGGEGAPSGLGYTLGVLALRLRILWARVAPPLTKVIEVNISNLAAVPSIIYGLLGLAVLVTFAGLNKSLLAGGITLAVLVLPIVIIGAREALRAVPVSIEQGAMALGASRWQAVWRQVFPAAIPGMLTGAILALSRAIGETAPLIVVGGVVFGTAVPSVNPIDANSEALFAMPLQIYFWADLPQESFRQLAAAGIIVLLATLIVMNLAAILLRNRFSRRW